MTDREWFDDLEDIADSTRMTSNYREKTKSGKSKGPKARKFTRTGYTKARLRTVQSRILKAKAKRDTNA